MAFRSKLQRKGGSEGPKQRMEVRKGGVEVRKTTVADPILAVVDPRYAYSTPYSYGIPVLIFTDRPP